MNKETNLDTEIKRLREEVSRLNTHWLLRNNKNYRTVIASQIIRGLAFGFGSVVGATIVVSIVGYILGQLEVVPIIGDWATEIGREILSTAPTD